MLPPYSRTASISASSSARAKRAGPPPAEEDDVGHDYDDCGSVGTEDISVAEIAHGVGELCQKRKGKAKGKKDKVIGSGNSKGKARAKPKAAAAAAAATATLRGRGREYACKCQPGQTAMQGATRTRAAQATLGSLEVPRRPVARLRPHQRRAGASRYPRWTLEIVLRSRSSTRSRVRGGGADTGDEKTMTYGY